MRVKLVKDKYYVRPDTDTETKTLSSDKRFDRSMDANGPLFSTRFRSIDIDGIEARPSDKITEGSLSIEKERRLLSSAKEPIGQLTPPPSPEGLSYLPYQIAGISAMVKYGSALLADDPGTGKSIQAAGVINTVQPKGKVLILCPASLRLNWKRELEKWVTLPKTVSLDPKEEGDIYVVSYDSCWRKSTFPILSKYSFDIAILDEAHCCKSPGSKRTIGSFSLCKKADRKILMTGTPILNRPIEIFPLLNALQPNVWKSESEFAYRYCNAFWEDMYIFNKMTKKREKKTIFNTMGSSNLEELKDILRSTIMIRRSKQEVLPQLPRKRHQIVEIPADKPFERKTIQEEAGKWKDLCDEVGYEEALMQMERGAGMVFEEMSKVRQKSALLKVPYAVQYIKLMLESVPKILVFAHHRAVVDGLYEGLSDDGVVKFVGGMSDKDKQQSVDAFQNDKNVKVFVGNIKAAGVGITLTASDTVVFVELDYTPGNMTQAEDRCCRIGATSDKILVQHLVYEKSMDVDVASMLVKKQKVAEELLS